MDFSNTKLVIGQGGSAIDAPLDSHLVFFTNDGEQFRFTDDGRFKLGVKGSVIKTYLDSHILFLTGDRERLRINDQGKVGIGTSDQTALLQLTKTNNKNTSEQILRTNFNNSWGLRLTQFNDGASNVVITTTGMIDTKEKFDVAAVNTGGFIWMYNGTTLVAKLTILATPTGQVSGDYIWIAGSSVNRNVFRWNETNGLEFLGQYLKDVVEAASGTWPSGWSYQGNWYDYDNTHTTPPGNGETNWYIRTTDQTKTADNQVYTAGNVRYELNQRANNVNYGVVHVKDGDVALATIEEGGTVRKGKVGIGIRAPIVALHMEHTDAMKVPKGTTAERPVANADTHKGYVRYNTTLDIFEGFGAGPAWGSLGGVIDVDQDTYIKAESTAGTDNDELWFYTLGSERMRISSNGNVGIGTNNPDRRVHIVGDVRIEGSLTTNGETTIINTNQNNTERLSITNDGTGPAIIANQKGSQPIVDFQDDGASVFYIEDGGNVGLGTNNPKGKLCIKNTNSLANVGTELDKFSLYFDTNDTSKRNGMCWTYNSSYGAHLGITCSSTNANTLELWGTNGRRINLCAPSTNETAPWDYPGLTVYENYVGIGTTDPYAKLHVTNGTGDIWTTTTTVADCHVVIGGNEWGGTSTNETLKIGLGYFDSATANVPMYIGCRVITSPNDTTSALVFGTRNSEYDNTAAEERMCILPNGNVGIGTTNPNDKLHISDSGDTVLKIVSTNATSPGIELVRTSLNHSNHHNSSTFADDAWTDWKIYNNGGNLEFQGGYRTATSGNHLSTSPQTLVTSMTMLNNGNVGIGTTSPFGKLDIKHSNWTQTPSSSTMCDMLNLMVSSPSSTGQGNMRTLLCFADGYRNDSATKDSYRVRCRMSGAGFDMIWNSSATETIGSNTSNNNFIFARDYTSFMNKNVGIGTTSPNSKLHLLGDFICDGKLTFNKGRSGNNGMGIIEGFDEHHAIYLRGNRTSVALNEMHFYEYGDFVFSNNGAISSQTEKVRIKADGNVGIGTSSPQYKLDIRNSGSCHLNIYGGATGSTAQIRLSGNNNNTSDPLLYLGAGQANSTNCVYVISRYDHPLLFLQNNSEVMRIHDNGNVGIGTTNPGEKLSVNGSIMIKGSSNSTTTNESKLIFTRDLADSDESEYIAQIYTGNYSGPLILEAARGGGYIKTISNRGTTDPIFVVSHADGYERFRINGYGYCTLKPFNNSGINNTWIDSLSNNNKLFFGDANFGIGAGKFALDMGSNSNSECTAIWCYQGSGRGIRFCSTTDGDGHKLSQMTTRMIVHGDTGNVGIGTQSPSHKLHVANLEISNTMQDLICLETQTSSESGHPAVSGIAQGILFKNKWHTNATKYSMARISAHSQPGYGGQLSFWTNNGAGSPDDVLIERLRINEDGYVGIGTTVPGQLLHIFNTSTSWAAYANIRLSTDLNNGNSNYGEIGYFRGTSNNTDEGLVFSGRNASRKDMVILSSNGNVGIGTTKPGAKLQVNGNILFGDGATAGYQQSGSYYIGLSSNSNAVGIDGFSGMRLESHSTGGNYSQDLKFYTHHYGGGTGGTPRMTIRYDGKVGIGTIDPGNFKFKIYNNTGTNTNGSNLWHNHFCVEESSAAGAGMTFKAGTQTGYIYYGSNTGSPWIGTGSFGFATTATGNSTDVKMIITNDGKVGINNRLSTTATLDIWGPTNNPTTATMSTTSSQAVVRISGAQGQCLEIGGMGSAYSYGLWMQTHNQSSTSNTQYSRNLCIQPIEGNVGIGTLSPNTKLHIRNDTDTTGTGDAFISNLSGNTGNRKPTECLRLQGRYNDSGSGALIRFTNYHASGSNPSNDEYNLAGIAGYDVKSDWGGGLCFYTAPSISAGGDLTARMVIDNVGNVGIGTTNPLNKLHTENIRIGDWNGSGNGFRFWQNADADLQIDYMSGSNIHKTMMIMDYDGGGIRIPNGNVGIRTTTPQTPLDITGDGTNTLCLRNGNDNNGYTKSQILFSWNGNAYNSGSGHSHKIQSRHQSGTNATENAIDFYLWRNGQSASAIGDRHGMSITAGGVGIGTTSPNYGLSLGTSEKAFALYENNGNYFYGMKVKNVNGWGINFYTSSGNDADGNIRMCIKRDSGYVGVGTTSPGGKLHTVGSSGVHALRVTGNCVNSAQVYCTESNYGIRVSTAASSGSYYSAYFTGSSGNGLYVRDDGDVGIGTTSPSSRLHVKDTTCILTLETTQGDENGRYCYIDFKDSGGSFAWFGDGSGSNKLFYMYLTDNQPFVITGATGSSTRVGIGNTNPGYMLDVSGDINFTGTLRQNGTAFSTNPFPLNAGSISGTAIIGKIRVGSWNYGTYDYMSIQHQSLGWSGVTGNYALRQNANGHTDINCSSSQAIGFCCNNDYKMYMNSSGQFSINNSSSVYSDAKISVNVPSEGTLLCSPDINQYIWRINHSQKWGIYWATEGSGNLHYLTTDSNPNEIVFVGNGTARASVDLDNGFIYSSGVKIGTNSSSSYQLHIEKGSQSSGTDNRETLIYLKSWMNDFEAGYGGTIIRMDSEDGNAGNGGCKGEFCMLNDYYYDNLSSNNTSSSERTGQFRFRLSNTNGDLTDIAAFCSYRGLDLNPTNRYPYDNGGSPKSIVWGWGQSYAYYIQPVYLSETTLYASNSYTRLQLMWHTGVHIGAHPNYGGTSFWDNYNRTGAANKIAAIGDNGTTWFKQNITCTGDITAFGTVSDITLKRNIVSLNTKDILNKVLKIRPVKFKWVDDLENELRRGKQDEGLIAQEVEKIWPMLVGETYSLKKGENDKIKYIHYNKLSVYLAGAIQEQQKQINQLKQDKETQKKEIIELRNENNMLKEQMKSVLERLAALESK